jgi:hypothetical protein
MARPASRSRDRRLAAAFAPLTAHEQFEEILQRHVDVADLRVHERLLAVQREYIRPCGYGAEGMTLSMIETAIALTNARIDAADLHRLVTIGKQVPEQFDVPASAFANASQDLPQGRAAVLPRR